MRNNYNRMFCLINKCFNSTGMKDYQKQIFFFFIIQVIFTIVFVYNIFVDILAQHIC